VLAEDAIRSAINDWKKKHPEAMPAVPQAAEVKTTA
jgi:hypothetical protein